MHTPVYIYILRQAAVYIRKRQSCSSTYVCGGYRQAYKCTLKRINSSFQRNARASTGWEGRRLRGRSVRLYWWCGQSTIYEDLNIVGELGMQDSIGRGLGV